MIWLKVGIPASLAAGSFVIQASEDPLPGWQEIAKGYGVASPMILLLIWLLFRAYKKLDEQEQRMLESIPLLSKAAEALNDNTKVMDEARKDRERDLIERLEQAVQRAELRRKPRTDETSD